jgi:hypothetical protein
MQDLITCQPWCQHVRAAHMSSLAPFFNSGFVIENAVHIAVADERPVLRNARNANDGIQRREFVLRNDGAPRAPSRQRAEQRALPCVRRVDDADVCEELQLEFKRHALALAPARHELGQSDSSLTESADSRVPGGQSRRGCAR